jgi:hypothetical protein
MLAQRAFRDTGNKRDYAAPILAYMAGRKMRQESEFDENKNADAKAYLERMDKAEQVRANKAMMAEQQTKFQSEGMPHIQKAYMATFRMVKDQTKDEAKAQQAASEAATSAANDWGNKNGMAGMPFIKNMVMFKDGAAFRGQEYDAKTKSFLPPANYKTIPSGQVMKDDGRGNWVPAENIFSMSEVSSRETAEAAKMRANNGGSGGKNKEQLYGKMDQWGKFQPVGYFRSQDEAMNKGATHLKNAIYNDEGLQQTDYSELFRDKSQAPVGSKAEVSSRPKVQFDPVTKKPIRQAAPAAPAQGAPQRVQMISPKTGQPVWIEGDVNEAINSGYKLIK